jgi:hypothetical protein
MRDKILEGFLIRQYEEGTALSAESDILDLASLGRKHPPDRYVATYRANGLIRTPEGEIQEADRFAVGVWFTPDYLRRAEVLWTLTWLGPRNVFHPNISNELPYICIGRLFPGTLLVDLIYQVFEIITYHKVTMREDDAMNREACAWARENRHRFPIDPRPLKRRPLTLNVGTVAKGA